MRVFVCLCVFFLVVFRICKCACWLREYRTLFHLLCWPLKLKGDAALRQTGGERGFSAGPTLELPRVRIVHDTNVHQQGFGSRERRAG